MADNRDLKIVIIKPVLRLHEGCVAIHIYINVITKNTHSKGLSTDDKLPQFVFTKTK